MIPPSAYAGIKQTLLILLPETILLLAAVAIITASVFVARPRQFWCRVSGWTIVVALVALLAIAGKETEIYSSVAVNDDLSFYGRLVLLLSALVMLGLAHEEPADDRAGEFFGSFLMMTAGALLVATANELAFLFVGLELVSIPTYLLLYLSRRNAATQEAATKYFFLSIFASALLLYGFAMLYGVSGITNLKALAFIFAGPIPQMPQYYLALVAIVFIIAGLSFRVAAVPLHFYAPDVYQGSPLVIAGILSWIPKMVGFLAMIRAVTAVFSVLNTTNPLVQKALLVAWIIAAATMILGNFLALLQTNLKRLLAYSSIAHAGYLMIGIAVAFLNGPGGGTFYHGVEAIFFYLVTYGLMTLGTFGVLGALKIEGRPVATTEDLSGLGRTQPLPALALTVCLLSLSGIPPLAGFWGKFAIFGSALGAQYSNGGESLLVLAVIGAISAAVGAFYYLRIVVLMYLSPPGGAVTVHGGWPVAVSVGACTSLTILLGLYSEPLASASRAAAQSSNAHPIPTAPESEAALAPALSPFNAGDDVVHGGALPSAAAARSGGPAVPLNQGSAPSVRSVIDRTSSEPVS
jgi:NADH-quinone oxidoreductase subunit N